MPVEPTLYQAAAEAGIPVQGHAGLVPRRSTWTGGLRAVGKTLDEAKWVYDQIKALEHAGAYAVEVEVIPEELLTEISKRTSLMTSSIGGGSGGDIQFLFADDILGNNAPPYPRHSKQYRDMYKMKQDMQREQWVDLRTSLTTFGRTGFRQRSMSSRRLTGLSMIFFRLSNRTSSWRITRRGH